MSCNPVPIKTTKTSTFLDEESEKSDNLYQQQEVSDDETMDLTDHPSESDIESEEIEEDFYEEEVPSPSMINQKVTALVAVIDTAAEDLASGHEQSKRCRRSSKSLFTKKIRVLLDSGSDGDIWFHRKGAIKRFPQTERQMVKSYHT